MGLGIVKRAFVALGKRVAKVFTSEVIKAAKKVVVQIPIVGLPLALALDLVGKAEWLHEDGEHRTGPEKFAYVLVNLTRALREKGIEEKRIGALIENALLVYKGEATIVSVEPELEEL